MPIFEVKNIKYTYDKYENSLKYALNDISFNIEKKDFVALIGKSGSGKSTLISHLNGLYKADSGDILYSGNSIYSKDYDLNSLRFKVGIVFQYPDYQLFSETVIDDVAFGAIKKGMSKDEAYKKSLEVLKFLNIEYLKDESPFNLSGGEKRKVAFAGVFVMEPEVLIFDEPDAGLDTMSKINFYNFIKSLNNDYGTTVIYITHNLDDVVEYANKVIVMSDGKLIKMGKPYEVLSDEKVMKEADLELPYSISICNKVKSMGYDIDNTKLTFSDLLDSLKKL
ncbi:MAG: energy-coupling factor transporter ATPase [Lachnospiraceae bacterium]|nr:energy-coupling factor transporter ATPase [Lachnospiraceae bacterium]